MRAAAFEWSDLKYFLAVARTGTLTGAAKRLDTEHSTVKRRITALEDAFGTKLFNRSPKGYVLTLHGERLLPVAESVETLAATSLSELGDEDLSAVGSVRIGAPDGFGAFFLAPRLLSLAEAHPELEIELAATPRVFSLSKREADIAVSLSRPEEGRLRARKLVDYDLAIYARDSYLARSRVIRAPEDFVEHRIVSYIDDLVFSPQLDFRRTVFKGCEISIRSSNIAAQLTATLAGIGLCLLPCFVADQYDQLVPVLDNQVRVTQTYWLVTHDDTHDLVRNRIAADFIIRQVQTAPVGYWRPIPRSGSTKTNR
jgi:DNA-binding transcriptional LysR family regulator